MKTHFFSDVFHYICPFTVFLLLPAGPLRRFLSRMIFSRPYAAEVFIQIRKIKGKSCIASQIVIYIRQPCTAAGQINALFCNMISDLWRGTFQKRFHLCCDLVHTVGDPLINNVGRNNFFSWKSGNTVDPDYFSGSFF